MGDLGFFLTLWKKCLCTDVPQQGTLEELQNIQKQFYFVSFILCNKIENFRDFWVVNFKEFLLFENIGKFRRFRLFYFGSYTAIENSENSEIFSRLVNFKGFFYLKKLEISEVSEFLILAFILKLKARKTWKLFQDF